MDLHALREALDGWGREFGFDAIGVSDAVLGEHPAHLRRWLDAGHQGTMDWMARNVDKRSAPDALEPGTLRVISARMDYRPPDDDPLHVLERPDRAYVSRYALGRDYHRVIRPRLARLAERLQAAAGGRYRAFTDSAPVLEKALAERAGLGWIGKNTLLLSRDAGSFFFLGEIFTDLPLPVDAPQDGEHCGSCSACLDACPTGAFVGPGQLDARRCIAYLTIEHRGAIPEPLRPLMGNRVFGCDDCQLVCPWNKFARTTREDDFHPRHGLEDAELVELFSWSEEAFLERTAGSAIRRTGYEGWLRNLAVALGNAPPAARIVACLEARLGTLPDMVAEHVAWALERQRAGLRSAGPGGAQRSGEGGAKAAATSAGGRRIVRR
ncbi:MAG: tRNA epoxyqueuosine(34) reductase QueG [Pseudomonadales bacterium]|nr:tRNA epoxyqueuosine(34) reductase QueG [Pseudomonadales bacterium]